MKKYLITTADEATWKFDEKVVFLGEWCRLYNRKHIWKEMDFDVAKPYSLDQPKKDTDFLKIRKLEKKLFPVFYKLLNENFYTSHSERFWQIILGNWFRKVLELILNRVNSIKECLNNYNIYGTTVYKNYDHSLITHDFASFENACEDDIWNNILCAKILSFLSISDIKIEYIEKYQNKKKDIKIITSEKNQYSNNLILNFLIGTYVKIAKQFVKKNDAFIINSYLPTKQEIKLELSLKQFPLLWKLQKSNLNKTETLYKPNTHLRKELKKKLINVSDGEFEKVVCELLFLLLPTCYLEGFKEFKQFALQQPWPQKPKFIFTSNNYESDDTFKFWTACKVEEGISYYVGQHGNNFGTLRNFSPRIEEITADKFLTWGFKKNLKHVPTFMFKTVGEKKKYDPKGNLVLIEVHRPYRYHTWDVVAEYNSYFEDQKEFVKILNKDPKKNLVVRFHKAYKKFRWDDELRWKDFDPVVKTDTGEVNIRDLISRSRLVVHSYDSTGMLETLNLNIPTLAFWQNGLDHLENSVKPLYQKLVDSGIVHLSSKSASDKVNNVWSDVDTWWNQTDVQEARKQFCECFAKESQNPILELKKIFI